MRSAGIWGVVLVWLVILGFLLGGAKLAVGGGHLGAAARAAAAGAARVTYQVLPGEGMSLRAVVGVVVDAQVRLGGVGDGHQVLGVDAQAGAAAVLDLLAFGDRPVGELVGQPVSVEAEAIRVDLGPRSEERRVGKEGRWRGWGEGVEKR